MPAASHKPKRRPLSVLIFAQISFSMELSRSKWLITSLSPGGGKKMSKHAVATGDVAGMLTRFAELNRKAERTGRCFPFIVIQEAELEGFWIHRVLQARDRKPHRRSGLDCHRTPAAAGQDRQDRWRGAGARAARL